MQKRKQRNTTNVLTGMVSLLIVTLLLFVTPLTVYADNTAGHNHHFTNPNWQNMHHYDYWNWQYNWAYHAPQYAFENTFHYNQWGRPTHSNVAPQHTQNIRRDRHAAALPPPHGSSTGFFNGEFPTGQVNPFAPGYNNNPNAGHAFIIEESVFALRPGESGVNVHAEGTHAGGFLASTSIAHSGGGNISGGETANGANAPWATPGSQSGLTVTYRPLSVIPQSGNQQNRVTTVVPFEDGTIGRITIPVLNNRTASVRPGVALSTLDNYVGHFSATSQWDGNIGLASHNRGRGSFFAGIWTLQYGDIIFYETTMGVRAFEVVSVRQIAKTDLSNLNHSHENMLSFVTCVYGQPALRWSVQAREIV